MFAPGLISYRSHLSQNWRSAIRQDSWIADLEALGFCGPTRDLLLAGQSALADFIGRSSEKTSAWREMPADIIFGPPIPDPDKIICIGLNYSFVAGYSAFNDVSARDLQLQVSQWTIGKAIDTFAPMGPGMVPAYLVPDPQKLELTTRLNGQVVQRTSTSDMIFSVAEIIGYLSRSMTLEPGDIIATGTPSGVGFKREPALFLKSGDVVDIEISSIGLLSNPVVRP